MVLSAASPTVRHEALDSLVADHHVTVLGDAGDVDVPMADSVRTLIERFYLDQFRNFQDPAAPYFLFMSQDANMAMGVGGVVRMRAYFDPGNSMPGAGFSPYFIPVGRTPLNRNHFGTTPSGTAIFMRVIGRNSRIGSYHLYVEAKFNGYDSRDFKLSKAFATVNDWTVGYASSTFADGAAVPPTVDASGPVMKVDFTTLLVRWMHEFGRTGLFAAASVETPQMSLQTDGVNTASRSASMPDIAAMVQYQWSSGQHVRLSAITRFLPYRDLVSSRNHTVVGYGLQLSAVFNPMAQLTVYGAFNCGRSYSNAGGDILLGEYDLVEDAGSPGRLESVPAYGYYIGLGYHFSRRLFSTVIFGQGRYRPVAGVDGGTYKYGLYGAANLFFNITPRVMVGAEFNIGQRRNFDSARGNARRIGAVCQFSF